MRDKPHIKILWLTALLIFAAALLNIGVASQVPFSCLLLTTPYFICAIFLTLVIMLRIMLATKAAQEMQSQELAKAEGAEHTLFESGDDESDPFSYLRSQQQFERFAAPLIAPVLCLVQGFFLWRFLSNAVWVHEISSSSHLPTAALFAAESFFFFLMSRYMLGLSQWKPDRLLRGAGIYTGLLSLTTLLCLLAALGQHFNLPMVNRIGTWILMVLLLLLAIENLFRSIVQCYQPWSKDKQNTSYESRLGRLLTDPGSWVNSASEALDYQFGFRISRTWFFRFLSQALLPLLIFQILVLYGLSCFVFLAPEEEGILERLGRPVSAEAGGLLQSGFHLKWPWPFETVQRYPTKRIQTQHIGFQDALTQRPPYMLWTIPHHAQKEIFLTASHIPHQQANTSGAVPVNFLSVHIPIQYRITNIYQYAYTFAEPDKLLKNMAYQVLTRQTVQYGLADFISGGRLELASRIQRQIQAEADQLKLGMAIEYVGLQGIHPPLGVAPAFESVVGAIEEKEAITLNARTYREHVLPIAAANATSIVMQAQAETIRKIALAEADIYVFEQRQKGFQASPNFFEKDIYLRTIQRALMAPRKYIVATDTKNEIIMFDLKEKLHPDLFDFGSDALEGLE